MDLGEYMKIFVDADGCPVVDIAINIAKEYGLEIVVVKTMPMKLVIPMQRLFP